MLENLRWIKNASFLWDGARKIYIDPWGLPDGCPPADAILITHPHWDHFSAEDVAKVRTPSTEIWTTPDVAATLEGEVNVVGPGDAFEAAGCSVDAVPAYNLDPENIHPKEKQWLGFVISVEGVRYYHAGDTDLIPEMEMIQCDVALLPIGGTATMDVAQAAEAARVLSPKLVVPMHYGFVFGTPSDGPTFVRTVEGVDVHAMIPEQPFEL